MPRETLLGESAASEALVRGPVTLEDVAREAGVSLATASRALNGSERKVGKLHREPVEEAAARLGYRANLVAQAFAKGATQMVSVVVSDIRDPYYSGIVRGVIDRAHQEDLVVTIAGSDPLAHDELAVLRDVLALSPRGIILTGSRFHDPSVKQRVVEVLSGYAERGGDIAIVGPRGLPFTTINLNDREAGRKLAASLIDLGYRAPGIIAGPQRLPSPSERLKGLVEGFGSAGISVEPRQIKRTDLTRESGYEAGRALIESGQPLDVVVGVTDVLAIGAMTSLRDLGITPGTGVAVAGFDNIVGAEDMSPPLTSVDMGLEEAGKRAVDAMSKASGASTELALQPTVCVRDSTPTLG